MKVEEPNPETVPRSGIDRVLAFTRHFQITETCSGKGPKIKRTREGGFTINPATLSKTAQDFVKACYEANLVQPLDWRIWSEEHGRDLKSETFIGSADLSTIIKMLTTHIRADRFCEGHILSAMKDGTILRILRRLEEISSQ